jgi:hypothetical protein
MSASPTEEPRYHCRPLTEQELSDGGFNYADPAWEIAYQLKDCSEQMWRSRHNSARLAFAVQNLEGQLQQAKEQLTEAIRILGQTIERSTSPWYVRIFWRWRQRKHQRKQERQLAEQKAELEKRERASREKQAEIAKVGGVIQQSRFRGRYS